MNSMSWSLVFIDKTDEKYTYKHLKSPRSGDIDEISKEIVDKAINPVGIRLVKNKNETKDEILAQLPDIKDYEAVEFSTYK